MDTALETTQLPGAVGVTTVRADGGGDTSSNFKVSLHVNQLLGKRKSLDAVPDDASQPEIPQAGEPKKAKLDDDGHPEVASSRPVVSVDKGNLPPEIWHRIFTFCPPKTLGNLLCVNRLFRLYLDPSFSPTAQTAPPSSTKSAAKPLKPNAIWQAARRLYWPYNPGPLRDETELDMWRLACSLVCQFCGKKDSRRALPSTDPLRFGPGADGVTCIWAFRVRCCGPCLSSRSTKEMDFLMSDIPSFLMPALPFVFSTPDLHIVPPTFIERAQFPVSLSLSKLFWSSDVESLHREFLAAKELGAPAVEEWQKGLALRGQEHRTDVAKWEKFADFGGLGTMRSMLYPGYQPAAAAIARTIPQAQTQTRKEKIALPGVTALPPRPFSTSSVSLQSQMLTDGECVTAQKTEMNTMKPSSDYNAWIPAPVFGLPSFLPAKVTAAPRAERSKEEIEQLKTARKAEILRRVKQLDPSMTEALLEQTTAFRAAIQIITPLDDTAWEVLKPRLLAQRAQLVDSSSATNPSEQLNSASDIKVDSTQAEQTNGGINAEWDEIQGPVRFKILKYADEVVRDWDNGEKVAKENAPAFAVDVLLHVRKRFYKEVEKDAETARAQKREPVTDPPEGPFTQKLTLENMKYVFDMKVRPLTEALRKELFLCNGCEVSTKFFGFDGVIQHYAAKHTTAFSRGSIVVHWRAEWPAVPPFKATARAPRKTIHPLPSIPPAPAALAPTRLPPQPGFSSRAPGPTPSLAPPVPVQPVPFAASSYAVGPFFSAMPQLPSLPFSSNIPYPEVQHNFGLQVPQTGGPLQQAFITQQHTNLVSNVGHFPPAAAPQGYGAAQPAVNAGGSQSMLPNGPSRLGSSSLEKSVYPAAPLGSVPATQYSVPPARYTQEYDKMAERAHELWKFTAKMTDMPAVIRVFTFLSRLDSFFRSKFGKPLPLSLFIEGLSNHRDMRPVRNINGLACKPCRNRLGSVPEEEKRRNFSLPQLVRHFETCHAEPARETSRRGPQKRDWFIEMLNIPPARALREMAGRQGQKYPLLFEAALSLDDQDRKPHERAWQKPRQTPRGTGVAAKPHERFRSGSVERKDNESQTDRGDKFSTVERYPQQGRSGRSKGENGKGAQNSAQGRSRHGVQRDAAKRDGNVKENEMLIPEKERRQDEAIRAMWATDRAQIVQAQSAPPIGPNATAPRTKSVAKNGPEPIHKEVSSVQWTRNPGVPVQHGQPPRRAAQTCDTFIKAEGRDERGVRGVPLAQQALEGPDLLGALEMRLVHSQGRETPPRVRVPPARVIYVDERGNEVTRHEPFFRETERQGRHEIRGSERGAPQHRDGRSMSPPSLRNDGPLPPVAHPSAPAYRSRSPLAHRYAGKPVYELRADNGMLAYERYDRAQRAPQPLPAYAPLQQLPQRQQGYYRVYVDGARAERPVEYEVVRVRRPDNSEYLVRLPMHRSYPAAAQPYDEVADGVRMDTKREAAVAQPLYRSAASGYETATYAGGLEVAAAAGVDAAYYEEYDPRYPSASASASAVPEDRRQMRYR